MTSDEIAILMARLSAVEEAPIAPSYCFTAKDARNALQQQAQEIKTLRAGLGSPTVRIQFDMINMQAEHIHELEAERDKLRETLAGMSCPRQLNAGTIERCTSRNQCSCEAGAVFVKTGAAQ